ncbi:hypothetical protein R3P38DRAFT_3210455 [Favolaschia claudopus]|uniref:Uncharacterized protein n=1 Tax=Favolaschia claudopus TaxID=2862362 RepID=A0AAW0AI16_9AGAR
MHSLYPIATPTFIRRRVSTELLAATFDAPTSVVLYASPPPSLLLFAAPSPLHLPFDHPPRRRRPHSSGVYGVLIYHMFPSKHLAGMVRTLGRPPRARIAVAWPPLVGIMIALSHHFPSITFLPPALPLPPPPRLAPALQPPDSSSRHEVLFIAFSPKPPRSSAFFDSPPPFHPPVAGFSTPLQLPAPPLHYSTTFPHDKFGPPRYGYAPYLGPAITPLMHDHLPWDMISFSASPRRLRSRIPTFSPIFTHFQARTYL